MRNALRGLATIAVVILAVYLLAPNAMIQQATASHQPADKIGVSASTVDAWQVQSGPGGPSSSTITILGPVTIKSSNSDWMIRVTSECALWTNIKAQGSAESQAVATVTVWVTINGVAVPVSPAAADDGKVVFCNRDFKIKTTGFTTEQIIELFLKTRSANGFNWLALDVTPGTYVVEVKATLEVLVAVSGEARAAVGKRTLLIEPAKLANDASF